MKLAIVFAAAALAACATEEIGGETVQVDATDGKADAAGEIRVRAPGLTVWLRPIATPRREGNETVWVLRGRASKNLDGVHAFIADDGFGRARTLSARTFEVVYDNGHELNSALSGLRLFLGLDVAGSDTAYTATMLLEPRYARFSGDSGIWLDRAMKPVRVGDDLVYRGRARTPAGDLLVSTDDDAAPDVAVRAEGSRVEWNLDYRFALLAIAADPPEALVRFFLDGTTDLVKEAGVDFAIRELGLTNGDPYETWPEPSECAAEVQACLDALPAGQLDTEACGAYREVSRCNLPFALPTLGASPDDLSAITRAMEEANAQLPPNMTASFAAYTVDSGSDTPPSIAQVLAAVQAQDPQLAEFWNDGAIDDARVTDTLTRYRATGVLAAAEQAFYTAGFRAGALRDVRPIAPGADQWTDVLVLHYPDAYRVLVLTLITQET